MYQIGVFLNNVHIQRHLDIVVGSVDGITCRLNVIHLLLPN